MKKILLGLVAGSLLSASEGASQLAVGALVESGHTLEYNLALKYGHYEANVGMNVLNIGYVVHEMEIAPHLQFYVTTGFGMIYKTSANVQLPLGLDYHVGDKLTIFAEVVPEYTFMSFEDTESSHETTSHEATGYSTSYILGARYSF